MKKKLIVLICMLLVVWVQIKAAVIIPNSNGVVFVKSDATGSGTGESWGDAATELSEALWAAKSNSNIKKIWVAVGNYYPKYNISGSTLGRDAVFMLVDKVEVYGGFTGSEQSISERQLDNASSLTVLDGEKNCFHVLQGTGLSLYTILDGFTIKGGYSDGTTGADAGKGGGIYLVNSDLQLSNIIFSRNYASLAGGAVYMDGGSSSFAGVDFINNKSDGDGGAVGAGQGGALTFSKANFTGNSAQNGGACHLLNCNSFLFSKTTFRGNNALGSGGAVYIYGDNSDNKNFRNVLMSGNAAVQSAGAINTGDANITLVNTTISGNKGGGIEVQNQLKIYNSVIYGNGTDVSGGMLIVRNSLVGGYTVTGSNDNIGGSTDPMFEDARPNSSAPSIDGNYQLKEGSPLINAGNGTYLPEANGGFDLAGNDRMYNNGIIDIGAYEFSRVVISPGADGVVYVKKGATGEGDSWENAVGELADAIWAARSNSTIREIWVAGGIYKPLYHYNNKQDSGRINVFELTSDIKLYGGFAGTETAVTQRDLKSPFHKTILSGNIGDPAIKTDNCYQVLRVKDLSSSALIDGFTISDGYADGPVVPESVSKVSNGGGMAINNSSVQLNNMVFSENYANMGGGVYAYGNSNPVFNNVKFNNNVGNYAGGGIYAYNCGKLTFNDVAFIKNIATTSVGGGCYIQTGLSAAFNRSVFQGNSTTASNASGGGVCVNNLSQGIFFTDVLVTGNKGGTGGGGIMINSSSATVTNATISGNVALAGAGLQYSDINGNMSSLTIFNTVISGNKNNSGYANPEFRTSQNPQLIVRNSLIAGFTTEGTPDNNVSGSTDPKFVNPFNFEGAPFEGGDYSLMSSSPLINAGSNDWYTDVANSKDLAGNPRIETPSGAGNIDIGAYEYTAVAPVITPDVNGVVYIKKGATGDGSSWGNAVGELADALLAVRANSSIREIWVAEGVYHPIYNVAGDRVTDRTATFLLVDGVKVYGGFMGTESLLYERDTHKTSVLSGDIGIQNDYSDNCYHLVIGYGLTSSTTLDGFTITHATADATSLMEISPDVAASNGNGAGLYLSNSSPGLVNLTFRGNMASNGAGVYMTDNSSPFMATVYLMENEASTSGGGIYSVNGCSPMLREVDFNNNKAGEYGGGMYISGGTPDLESIRFTGNTTALNGGGIYVSGVNSMPLSKLEFNGNKADGSGAAVYAVLFGTFTFSNCSFFNNESVGGYGAGIYGKNGTVLKVSGSRFFSNQSKANGGGLYLQSLNSVSFSKTEFRGNTTTSNGGAAYLGSITDEILFADVLVSGNSAAVSGGGICCLNSNLRCINMSVSGNNAGTDGGGIFYNNPTNSAVALTLQNCVVSGNSKDCYIYNNYANPVIKNSLIGGVTTSGTSDMNIDGSVNPMFVDAPGFSNAPFTNGDYQLQSGSPLIDAGDSLYYSVTDESKDLAGNPRVYLRGQGGNIDIGAYESPYEGNSITVQDISVKYGDTTLINATSSNGNLLTMQSSDELIAKPYQDQQSGEWKLIGIHAGTTELTVTELKSDGSEGDRKTVAVTVEKAVLTVKATDLTRDYDGTAFSGGNGVNYDGFLHNDDETVLGGTLTYNGDAQGAVKAGVYSILPEGLTAGDYEIHFEGGQLNIKKLLLTVTLKDSTKGYDGQPFHDGNGVIFTGFVNGEDDQVLGGTLAYTGDAQGAVNAGSYKIEATGLVSDNYNLDYVPGTLTIKKLPLTITAKDVSKTYDGLAFTGGNGVSYSGFVNGEDEQVLTGTLRYDGDAQQAVNSGDYKITPSGFSASNYTLLYTDGVLHITPASLLVTARDAAKDYDGKTFIGGNGLTYSGFVNGETEQVITGTAVYGGDAQGAVNAGSYTISVNGLFAANYQLSFVDGSLNIQKLPLTATAKDASRTYNGLAFTGGNGITYSGFVNGENESVVSGTVTYGGDAQGAVNAGDYSITASGLTADNYTLNFKPGKLTITKAVLTVTARDAGKVYNGQPFSNGNGVDYSGFMQGENESVLKNQLSYTGTSQGAINAGDYVITPGGYTADNYALQYVSGTLTISKAVLSVRPNDEARCYGLANPVFTVQYKGFVNGETEAVVAVKPTATTIANTTTAAGTYDITVTGGTAVNYTLNPLKGALTVYALPESELTAVQGTILCGDNAVIPLTASGAYQFNWYRSDAIVNGASGSVLNVNTTGTYSARATDSHGCSAPVRNEIVVTRQLPYTADFSFNQYCAGISIPFTNLSQGAGNSAYTYQWQTSAGHTANTYNAVFRFANAGDYTVTLTVTPAGCASLAQSNTKHIEIEQPIPGVTLPTRSATAGSGILLEARKLTNASYNWTPASGLSDYRSDKTTATLLRSQTYLVNMNFPSGCTTVDTLGVTVTNMAAVLVPNVFTPNGDGNNDVLLPNLKGVKQLRYFRVFNRAGKKLFESSDLTAGWDGRLQGVLQPFDTYVWTSEGIDYNGNTVRNQGSVTLLR